MKAEGREEAIELLPCPFCGTRASQLYNRDDGEYVACERCNIRTGGWGDHAEAIAVWNRRAASVDRAGIVREVVERLKAKGIGAYWDSCCDSAIDAVLAEMEKGK